MFAAVAPAANAFPLGSATVVGARRPLPTSGSATATSFGDRYGAAHGLKVTAPAGGAARNSDYRGHAYHLRFRLIWPVVVALRRGFGNLPLVSDAPGAAIEQQIWETRDVLN